MACKILFFFFKLQPHLPEANELIYNPPNRTLDEANQPPEAPFTNMVEL